MAITKTEGQYWWQLLMANENAAAVALAFGMAGMRNVRLVSEAVAIGLDKAERRLAVRFPIEQEVRYKVIKGNTMKSALAEASTSARMGFCSPPSENSLLKNRSRSPSTGRRSSTTSSR